MGSIDTSKVLNHYELLEIEGRIYQKAKKHGVLIGKGSLVAVDGGVIDDLAFRLTFAACPEEDKLRVAIMRFAKTICTEFLVRSFCTPS